MDRKITIMDVAKKNNIEIIGRSGQSFRCVCPICGGRGVMTINPTQNLFNCFLCPPSEGMHGNTFDLEIKLNPWLYGGEKDCKKVAKNIYEYLKTGVCTEEKMSGASVFTLTEDVTRASDEYVSAVYKEMLTMLTLKKDHEADLKRRGLNDAEIKYFKFRSTPTDGYGIARKLMSKGYNLKGVPGFCKKNGDWTLHVCSQGYLCPVWDDNRNILGFQIRVDKPFGGGKYLWLSSSGKEEGTGSGALSTYLVGLHHKECVIITEGILKATVIYSLLKGNVTVIGVAGIQSIKALRPIFEQMGTSYVFEAYDMDKRLPVDRLFLRNKPDLSDEEKKEIEKADRIQEAADKLISLCEEYDLKAHPLKWDVDRDNQWKGQYKGLDDFLYEQKDRDVFLNYLIDKTDKYVRMKKMLAS